MKTSQKVQQLMLLSTLFITTYMIVISKIIQIHAFKEQLAFNLKKRINVRNKKN